MKGIEFTAKYFLREYGTDVYKICRNLGIHIQHHNLGDNIKGYIINIEGLSFITINSILEEWKKHLVLAHELGHFALHEDEPNRIDNSLFIDDTRLEYDATEFAMHLIGNKRYLNDCLTHQVGEFILKMYSSKKQGNRILDNMGLNSKEVESSIRISLGHETTSEDIDIAIGKILEANTNYLNMRNKGR